MEKSTFFEKLSDGGGSGGGVDRLGGAGRAPEESGERALGVVLEHIPRAAFICDRHAHIARANAEGKRALAADEISWRGRVAAAVRGEESSDAISVSKISVPGEKPRYLVVARTGADPVEAALEVAKRRWVLSERESAVLCRVASGMTNREIAEDLGLASRTVELRITSLLRKAEVDSRAQLIVSLWELSEESEG